MAARTTAIGLFLAVLAVAPDFALADPWCGGVSDSCQCGAGNPYPCCDNGGGKSGNCTWGAWHMACCNWALGMPSPWQHAKYWAGNYSGHPDYDVLSNPVAGSIGCRTVGTYGHVAWVTGVSGGTVYIHEQSCCWGCHHGFKDSSANAGYFNGGYIVKKGTVSECTPGQQQSQGCGKCGTKKRTCKSNGKWGGWGGCTGQGACSPGQTQSGGCGNCGNHSRSCKSNCQWGGWGGCAGQGPCASGSGQTEDCGDCGEHSRSCGGNCQWGGWSLCNGPDPDGGNQMCDTGEFGVCAEGRMRCLKGWLECVRLFDPSEELCDDLDNDCEGEVDDGFPQILGDIPPPFAALVSDVSQPLTLFEGEVGVAWVEFTNVGADAWPEGEVWLKARAQPGAASPLAPPGAWPAWDTAAALTAAVAPQSAGRFEFEVCAPGLPGQTVMEQFYLVGPMGRRCAARNRRSM